MSDDRAKIRKVLDVLRKKENVIGGSLVIQPREIGGRLVENTEVVRVYVTKKVERDALTKKNLLPECVMVDGKLVEVDVVEIGELKALTPSKKKATNISLEDQGFPDPKLKYRPLRMGISTMNSRSTGACSLGTFARDNSTNKIVQLSNQHCFGLENDAAVGDLAVQPSIMDGGTTNNCQTGRFVRGVDLKFVEFNCEWRNTAHRVYRALAGIEPNIVDVSCASIDDGIGYEMKTPDGEEIIGWTDPGEAGAIPWAYGRSSGYSYEGQYVDFSAYVTVGYRRGKCVFQDVVIGVQNDTFKCIPGDSGSPWFEKKYLIGLRFAGSDSTWIGCKWRNIERELNVSFIQ